MAIDTSEIKFSAEINDHPFGEYTEVTVTAVVVRCIRISSAMGLSKAEAIETATQRLRHHFEHEVFR